MARDEFVDVVDENDFPLGTAPKEEKFARGFISRNVAVILADPSGRLIITRRAATKKSYPNRYDASAVGNVSAGESYETAARRELLEELGLGCKLTFLGKKFNEFKSEHRLRYFTGIFFGVWDGNVGLRGDESSDLKKVPVAEVSELIDKDPSRFTPGFVAAFPVVASWLGKYRQAPPNR